MDHYADDLAALTEHLDLKDAVHVGQSESFNYKFSYNRDRQSAGCVAFPDVND